MPMEIRIAKTGQVYGQEIFSRMMEKGEYSCDRD